ncbi:MAG: helix-turn-helix transcriptional regulator [SAR202 cluster bacterium]|nr:helix-turn-helix transcriptional regulator [SAR202 cluster bacterium]
MSALATHVKNAERMLTFAKADREGIRFVFADGQEGILPFSKISEIGSLANLDSVYLPNPYQLVLHTKSGDSIELPWDYVRPFCDKGYKRQSVQSAKRGREILGTRIRRLREEKNFSQGSLAEKAGIGRITLLRIEKGEHSPRYTTLSSIANSLGVPLAGLLTEDFI